ncbi:MAG: DUF4259 domain-containing protein [Streptosporangiaceae bacterium]
MGAWDLGPFENDGAMDFFGAMMDSLPADWPRLMTETMSEVLAVDYVENPEMQGAVAAASLLASRLDPTLGLPRHYRDQWFAARFEVTPELRELATGTFARAFDEHANEWFELWTEAGTFPEVTKLLAPYRQALTRR